MCKIKLISITIGIILAGLTACGGSGGDTHSDNAANMKGTWTGAITKISDNCTNSNNLQTVNFTHTVNQNGNDITLADKNGLNYTGRTADENGFAVDGSQSQTNFGKTCVLVQKITYNEIDSNNDNTASVDFNITRTCEDSTICSVIYTGTASRIGGTTTTPSPSSSPTTPIAGGCGAINERPAAGTYSGNGGCGISEVGYKSLTQGTEKVVVLDPFGINGATSFAYTANTATSKRNDLTIKDEAGYSCSITCSPPATFTVSCFKEGGTSCIEKF